MRKILLMLALLVVAVPPAFAQMNQAPMRNCQNCDLYTPRTGGMMGMGGMDRMGDMMGMCLNNADKIGLTADQVKKITPIHREMQKSHIRFKADVNIAEMELMEIMEVKDFDLEKASAAVKRISDLKTAHHLENLKYMKEVRAIITDEQFKKMKQLMATNMNMKKPVKKMIRRQRP